MNSRELQRCVNISRGLMPVDLESRTFHTTFIYRKGKLQKIGINSTKTHPRNFDYDYRCRADNKDIRAFVTLHSELSAVLKYGREDCSDCIFVNVRIDRNGQVAMAKPCSGCQDMLNQVGYKRIFFTNEYGKFEQLG